MQRLLFALCILMLLPTFAQTQGSCDINLEDAFDTLIRAQRAADSGDDAVAISLLTALQDNIDSIQDECNNALALLGSDFTNDDESLAFRYPEDWVVDVFEGNFYATAPNSTLLNQLEQDAPDFEAGDFIVAVIVQETFGDSFEETVENFEDNIEFTGFMSPQQEVMIGNTRAIQAIYNTEFNVPILATYLDFTEADDRVDPATIIVVAFSLEEELAIAEVYANSIAQSIEYPALVSLREAGIPLSDLVYGDPIELEDLSDDLDKQNAVISPDGTKIASASDELCVYSFEMDDTSCQELPDRTRPSTLYWSPNSRYVAFHENFVRTFRDSDLFVYDIQDESIITLTDGDDDTLNFLSSSESEGTIIFFDGTITWGLDNQIYMLRTIAEVGGGFDSTQNVLVRVNPETGDIEDLADLTDTLAPLSIVEYVSYLDGVISVSPDATQIAISYYDFREDSSPNNGIWVYNLLTDELTQVATQADISTGLPIDFELASNRQAIALAWDSNNQGIYAYYKDFLRFDQFTSLYYIDTITQTTTAITDYSNNSLEDLRPNEDGLSLQYDLIDAPIIAPNADGIIYLNHEQDMFGLSALAFGEDNEIITLTEASDDSVLGFSDVTSVSRDGKLLIAGLLYLPE